MAMRLSLLASLTCIVPAAHVCYSSDTCMFRFQNWQHSGTRLHKERARCDARVRGAEGPLVFGLRDPSLFVNSQLQAFYQSVLAVNASYGPPKGLPTGT